MIPKRTSAVAVILILGLVLAGCAAQAPSVAMSTPTGPEFDATKEALETQRNNEQATAGALVATMVALGTPLPTPMPFPTLKPAATPVLGIFGCGEADQEFTYGNCWIGQYNNEYLFVAAGAPKSDPTLGLLRVITSTLDQRTQGPEQPYRTPSHHGRILITSYVGEHLTLQAEDNTLFTFDLPTRHWVNSTASVSSPPSAPVITPTRSQQAVAATKVARDQAERAAVATIIARGTPVAMTPLPLATTVPLPPPDLGLHSCGDGDKVYDLRSCWTGITNNEYVFVNTGASWSDETQGVLRVITGTLDMQTGGSWQIYTTPNAAGAVWIVNDANWRLTLETENGTRFLFDLTTHQWLDSPAPTIVPTLPATLPPSPTPPQMTPVDTPHQTAGAGIIWQETWSPRFNKIMYVRNQWVEHKNNQTILVCAGSRSRRESPQWGTIGVVTQDATGAVLSGPDLYPLPQQGGVLHIIDAVGERLTLQADNNTLFIFDLPTRQWVNP